MSHYMLLPFDRYWETSGRSRRKEYWLFTLFLCITNLILVLLEEAFGLKFYGMGLLSLAYSILTIVPAFTVSIRRLHDIDRSGWWLLIVLIPFFGLLYLIYLACQPGTEGPNRFGNDPKAV